MPGERRWTKRSVKHGLIVLGFLLSLGLLLYWYLPIHFVGSNQRIEALVNQLASSNSPPVYPGSPPHFYIDDFLANNQDWNPEAQRHVSHAYYELKALGKTAFPYLIKYLDDDRYSHERSYSTFVSQSVGDACEALISEQLAPSGSGYKMRETATRTISEHDVSFERFVRSRFGSYAAWWRNNRFQSIPEMKMNYCRWRIQREKNAGFASKIQEDSMTDDFQRWLAETQAPIPSLQLPPPEGYSIDAIVQHIERQRLINSSE